MWKCEQCGEEIEDQFEACWKCTRTEPESPPETEPLASQPAETTAPMMPPSPLPEWRLKYQYFRGSWVSWTDLFSEAAAFATRLGRDRVVSISHSEDQNDGIVTVWYWAHVSDEPMQ